MSVIQLLLLITAMTAPLRPQVVLPGRNSAAGSFVCPNASPCDETVATHAVPAIGKNHIPVAFLPGAIDSQSGSVVFSYASFPGGIPRSSSILLCTIATSSDL